MAGLRADACSGLRSRYFHEWDSPSGPTWCDSDDCWPGTILAKGILIAADARRAVDCGVDGLIVSNHGGRTMDGIEASLRALPEVIAAVPTNIAVLLDSGVRRGTDVIKALCLGARAVLIGRPYMFALSYGEAGVARLLATTAYSGQRLGYNMSLEYGGLFDINANWNPPHQSHRLGTDVDLRLVAPEQRQALQQMIYSSGISTIFIEGNHWHLRQ